MQQSGIGFQELARIFTPIQEAKKRVRQHISDILRKEKFEWMVDDVLRCDEHDLINYSAIGFFYAPSSEFAMMLKEAGIYNYAECGSCKGLCTPVYLYGGKEPLCHSCAKEILN